VKSNGSHQLLVYVDDVNLLGDTETVIDASKVVAIEINLEEARYMLLSLQQNARQNQDVNIVNRSFENAAQFKYLGTTITIQNLIQEQIKREPNSGNAYYHSVQNLLYFHLLPKNVNIRICKIIILPDVLYGCETYSLSLREKHRLRVFENWDNIWTKEI
jgi:hypothetical protein